MPRAWSALALSFSLLAGSAAGADTLTPAVDPAVQRDDREPHLYPLSTQAAVGAVAGVAALVGVALVANVRDQYGSLEAGSLGTSCRPCSSSDLTGIKAQTYTGFALIGVGGVLAITDIALAVLDRRYRREKLPRPTAQARTLSLGARF